MSGEDVVRTPGPRPVGRVVAVLAVALAALAATTLPAGGAGAAGTVEGVCGTDTLVVVFWPRGHVAIPQLGLPRAASPQLVVLTYAGAGTFQKAFIVASAAGGGGGRLVTGCSRTRDHTALQVLPARATTQPAAITCRTRGHTLVQLRKIAGAGVRWELRLIEAPNRLVLRAMLTATAVGSNVMQSFQRCRVGPAPPRTSL
ncbi:MAG TPA: hypothetical protein VH572_10225 [Gaiella sp.]